MELKPSHLSINQLFNLCKLFRLPRYQRSYAWEQDALSAFTDDLLKCIEARQSDKSRNHFFGGLVVFDTYTKRDNRPVSEVIDGQQRIASFTLLFAALKYRIQELQGNYDSASDTSLLQYLESLDKMTTCLNDNYIYFSDSFINPNEESIKLTMSDADDKFFKRLIESNPINPSRESHERINLAWSMIRTFVADKLTNTGDLIDSTKTLDLLLNKVLGCDCTVILMRSHRISEAYHVFQVLNDRGAQLTEGDLLRSHTLALLEKDGTRTHQRMVADLWDKILAFPEKNIDDYLRWYYASWEGARPKKTNLADQFLENRFHLLGIVSVNRQKAKEVEREVRQLKASVQVLHDLRSATWPYPSRSNRSVTAWDRQRLTMLVGFLGHSNAMPLLLAMRDRLDEESFAAAVSTIERFVFRYKTIGGVHISRMTAMYLKHAVQVREAPPYLVENLRHDLTQLVLSTVPDNVFKAKLMELTYGTGQKSKAIRYLFMTLEDYMDWHESGDAAPPTCKRKYRLWDIARTSVEHVYPQNATPNHIDNNLEEIKDSIGNLTLIGPNENSAVGNLEFDKKKAVFSKSDLSLNRKIAQLSERTADEVTERTENLANMALRVFVP